MSWYYPKKGSKRKPNGIRLRPTSKEGDSWWSEQWLNAITKFTKPNALERGHHYAASGQVLSIQMDEGFAEALVQGSRTQPYRVEIGLPMLTQSEAKQVADALMKKALYVAKILAGELPHAVAKIFEDEDAPLFPASAADISTDCSCPEEKAPCKHVTAVYYILGQEFDRDPFLILEMRGLSRAQLLTEIQLRRSVHSQASLTPSLQKPVHEFPTQTVLSHNLHDFYNATKDHALTGNRPDNFLETLPAPGSRIRELGAPPFWQSDYDFQDVMNNIYKAVRKKGLV